LIKGEKGGFLSWKIPPGLPYKQGRRLREAKRPALSICPQGINVVPKDDFTSRQDTFSAGEEFSIASMRAERLRGERIALLFGKRSVGLPLATLPENGG
jgi:hypothetical protein